MRRDGLSATVLFSVLGLLILANAGLVTWQLSTPHIVTILPDRDTSPGAVQAAAVQVLQHPWRQETVEVGIRNHFLCQQAASCPVQRMASDELTAVLDQVVVGDYYAEIRYQGAVLTARQPVEGVTATVPVPMPEGEATFALTLQGEANG